MIFLKNYNKYVLENIKWDYNSIMDVVNSVSSYKELREKYPYVVSKILKDKKLEREVKEILPPSSGNYDRYIYSYEFPDKSVYIGLTYDLNFRKSEHKKNSKSTVNKYIKKTKLEPKFVILTEDPIPFDKAGFEEDKFINYYKDKGFKILNKVKAGGLGGNYLIWDYDKCKESALQCNSKIEFKDRFPQAYTNSRIRGWLDEITTHMDKLKKDSDYWTYDVCKEEALKYKTRKEFENNSSYAYNKSIKMGWLDEITSHMEYVKMPNGYWNLKRVKEEALKYNTRTEFKNGSNGAYNWARKNNVMDKITKHM